MSAHICPPNMDVSRDMLTQNRGHPTTTSSYSSSSVPNRHFGPETSSLPELSSIRRNVARNLFGPPDPKSTQYAQQKVLEMRDRDSQRWNFDFDKEKPLEGRFKWEPVSIEEDSREYSSSCHVPRPYALSRLPYLSSSSRQSPSTSKRSVDGPAPKSVSERDSLFIVIPGSCATRWESAAGGTASDVGGGSGSGDSESDEREGRSSQEHPPGSSASTVTRSSSQSISSASSQYSLPSPNRSPPVQIDPLTIPIPSPPEDYSSSCSSSTSICDLLPPSESSSTSLQHTGSDCKLKIKKKTQKQPTIKDFMPVKRRSSSQATGVPEKKAAM